MIKLLILFSFCFLDAKKTPSLDIYNPKWKWMDEQIEKEFYPFEKNGITLDMLNKTMDIKPKVLNKHMQNEKDILIRYRIVKRKVYGPSLPIKDLLKKAIEIYPIPDVDIILCNADMIQNPEILLCPVLATCKEPNTENLIHFITHDRWVDMWSENIEEVEKGNKKFPWKSKISKIIWRGSSTDSYPDYNIPKNWPNIPRLKLCSLSKQSPDIVNARLHFPLFIKDKFYKKLQHYFVKDFFPVEDHIQYKYQIQLDGVVAAWPSLEWKLLSNCVIFKQESTYTLWHYKLLKPYKHYIPIKRDLSDLLEKLQWAKENDNEAQMIAKNGMSFAKENLMYEHLYLYYYKVLLKYASLQKFKPKKPLKQKKNSHFWSFVEKLNLLVLPRKNIEAK
jgi:hypothetical protein